MSAVSPVATRPPDLQEGPAPGAGTPETGSTEPSAGSPVRYPSLAAPSNGKGVQPARVRVVRAGLSPRRLCLHVAMAAELAVGRGRCYGREGYGGHEPLWAGMVAEIARSYAGANTPKAARRMLAERWRGGHLVFSVEAGFLALCSAVDALRVPRETQDEVGRVLALVQAMHGGGHVDD